MNKISFGKTRETTTIDTHGSTVSIEHNIVKGKTVDPKRTYYEIRIPVKDKKEEMTEYLRFTDTLDDTKKDPNFRIEYTNHGKENGYYYVVKCWTELDYTNNTD